MSDLSSIGPGPAGSPSPVCRATPVHQNGAVAPSLTEPAARLLETAGHDRVELSNAARFMDLMRQLPSLPADRIGHIRQAIKEGNYDTPDKFDIALERLIDDLEL
jgi:negative regulator of flagellin synthesis FlgM